MEEKLKTGLTRFYDRYYKLLLLIPAIILLLSFIYMGVFYSKNGDFVKKDISLTGGTSVTIYEKISIDKIQSDLSGKLEEVEVREISDLITREQKAIIIETKSDADTTKKVLEEYLGHTLTAENSSFEFTGSSLSSSFFKQLVIAVIIAFILMTLVVFIIFRTFVPSMAVVLSAFADIFMTLTAFNLLGLKLSSAGIVAFLMLIGYSVDTDILLTNRVLRRQGHSIDRKIWEAFKTGITMTLVSLVAVAVAFIVVGSFSGVLTQIFTVILVGLGFDIFNTWVTNASIIKWYAVKLEKNENKA
ncbi:MAG: protein translocase subunit SecF [Candidatus Pacearchaeota archaeon]|nr:protein translocase subunit SecF [Candidatus Pacearchaeota archaeon]